ncbi:MAG: DUF1311 domain-containing protein [Methylobacteriaceae bacterium]|nr:DUF1311 domain-containing protein [Paracoccaceae bacterium]MCO5087028.1 DUF1311 domain-containing protein [Methylobacteriaceae bacterium]
MKALAIALVLPVAAWAETPLDRAAAGAVECLEIGDRTCIGNAARFCMEATPEGQTTLGMSACLMAERDAWDRLLNEEYARARAESARVDAADTPDHAVRAARLRDAQRAWIAYRDANCAVDYALPGGGSLRQITGAHCVLRMTAERSFELRALVRALGGD